MRRLLVASIAALSSIGLVQIASAADLPTKAPIAIAPSWTGFYIGANFGGGWGNRSFDYTANDASSALLFNPVNGGQPPSDTMKTSGVLGGLQLGYNWQFAPKWVAGGEADFDFSGMRGTTIGAAQIIAGNPVTATLTDRLKYFGTLRARLGYIPMDNLLVFATGGLAYAKLDRNGDYTGTSGVVVAFNLPPVSVICFPGRSCFNGGTNSWVAGWTIGGGVEYLLAPRWTIKGEYLHASLAGKSITETGTAPLPGNPCCSTFNANFGRTSIDIVRLGLNYRL